MENRFIESSIGYHLKEKLNPSSIEETSFMPKTIPTIETNNEIPYFKSYKSYLQIRIYIIIK